MSPITTLSVLGFASAALAVPYHGHGHQRHHHGNHPGGFSAFPYPSANGTVIGSTGFATGTASPATESAVASESLTTIVEPSTYFNAASGTICTTDVTVTSKVQVTVTVTLPEESVTSSGEAAATEAASTSASSSRARSTQYVTSTLTQQHTTSAAAPSSSEAAPVESSSAASSSAASSSSSVSQYSAPASSSSAYFSSSSSSSSFEAAPVTASSSSAESTSAVMPTMTYSTADKQPAYTSSSSSAAPTQTSSYSGSSGSGKRGVAYNDASLTECFTNNPKISWGYNWGSSSSGLSTSLNYIPQLWDGTNTFTDSWLSNAKSAIKSGSTHLFSFNEPDLGSQANMSPSEAAAAYKTYMQPFAGQAKLCAPAVTNGGGAMGLDWLMAFMDACTDCTIDCVNVHWYDSAENADYFKKHVSNATQISNNKPVFVSEFGATGSDDQIGTFLGDVMSWMDGEDAVAGYAYFMVTDGKLVTGTEPSVYGKVYAS